MCLFVRLFLYTTIISFCANASSQECGFATQTPQCWASPAVRPTLSGTPVSIVTTHFRIQYTTSGADAITEACAQSAATFAEECYTAYSNLGWHLPPPDGGNGGDTKYDIYFRDISGCANGITLPESSYTAYYPTGTTSWIEIRNTYAVQLPSADDELKALIAHEMAHAIQDVYSTDEGTFGNWFYESSAVYMENIIYPNVDRLINYFLPQDAPNPLNMPYLPIDFNQGDNSKLYKYSSALFQRFLHQKYGSDVIKNTWEKMGEIAGDNIFSSIDDVLQNQHNSTLNDALKEYAVWRYFTGTRADNSHFLNASQMPTSYVFRSHIITGGNGYDQVAEGADGSLSGLGGTVFIELINSDGGTLSLNFNGQDMFYIGGQNIDAIWGCTMLRYRNPNPSIMQSINEGQNNISWTFNPKIVFIPVVLNKVHNRLGYSNTYSRITPVAVTFTNKYRTANVGGSIWFDNLDSIPSGQPRNLDIVEYHSIKPNVERFSLDSVYKHLNWNGTPSNKNLDYNFISTQSNVQDANFRGIVPTTIKTELADVTCPPKDDPI